jgi:hypothetical protein
MKTISEVTTQNIKQAFYDAEQDKSNLREFERDLYGFSGAKIRHTINNICSIKEKMSYLELGVYRGSTLIAANFRTNVVQSYGIDDFTIDHKEATPYKPEGWSNPRIVAEDLLERYKKEFSTQTQVKLINSEARKTELSQLRKVDIIHYDLEEHHAGVESTLRYFLPKFDKHVILLISNWNSAGVRTSYKNFAKTPGLKVELVEEKLSSSTGNTETWYNGFSASLVSFVDEEETTDA